MQTRLDTSHHVGPSSRVRGGSARSGLGLLCVVPSCLVSLGCSISPQPVPPPEPTSLSIDASLIGIQQDGSGNTSIYGTEGAVTASAEVLRVTNLEGLGPFVEVDVHDNGSFELAVEGTLNDSFRLQARAGTKYSAPVDIRGQGAPGPVGGVPRPFNGCLRVEPTDEIAFDAVGVGGISMEAATIYNDCPFELFLSHAELRHHSPQFQVFVGPPTDTIAPGSRYIIGVAFAPGTEGLHEDLLLLSLEKPPLQPPPPGPDAVGRWVLGLRGQGVTP